MFPRAFLTPLFFCVLSFCTAQMSENTFGKLSLSEKEFSTYEKDPEATAVVLYERGDNYFKVIDRHILLVKEYHTRIKILDEKGFDYGTIEIPLYHKGSSSEKVTELKAVTHNGTSQYNVLASEIFTTDETERWRNTKFTFPKIQKGSILEYKYTVTSPYDFNFQGWKFQSDIPKLYSEFNASIPGNYVYNRVLTGSLELKTNDAHLKKNCFHVEGYPNSADCEVLKYTMENIPAFKVENEYSLSSKNYISQISFELSEFKGFDGTTNKYTETWKDVDRKFRTDKDIGRQLTKKGFFERNVPQQLLVEGDAMTRAKNIYKFVQGHFTWNERYSTYGNARVKDAFETKKGNAWEINMSLINLLNAAGIKTHLMMLSTRQRGLPKRSHPVLTDFNYVIAKTTIDGQDYFLDATDPYHPFGYLPYRTLNHYGRVMDFKNESYWHNIVPQSKNKYQIRASIRFDAKKQNAIGVLDMMTYGYEAIKKRKRLNRLKEEEYLDDLEDGLGDDFSITEYQKIEERSDEERVSERFSFELSEVLGSDMVYFNPFLIRFFEENPFQMEERNYPIDFGYPVKFKYQINIQIPEGYQIHELPEKEAIALGEDKRVVYHFDHKQNTNNVIVSFDLALNSTYFLPENYETLKDIFKKVTNTQKNSLIVLKKL